VAGQGNYEEPSGSLNIHVLYGACLPGTTDPVLLADLSNQGDPALGELQLAGALVSASSAQGETVALYRGTATWLDGPEVASPPSAFAAEIVFDVPSDISMLRVAFFGTAPDLSGASATCQGQGTGGVSTGATSVPTTSTGTTSACDTSGAGGSGSSSPAAGSTSGSSSASTASTGSGASGSSGGTQGAPQGNGTPAGTPSGSSDGAQSGTTDSSGSPTAAQNAQPTAVAGTTTDPGS